MNTYSSCYRNSTLEGCSDWQAVVYCGLGQLPYKEQHPLVQLALGLVPVVHTVQIPFHGWQSPLSGAVPKTDLLESVKQIYVDSLRPIVEHKKTLFLCYSGSGVWLMKALPRVEKECQMADFGCILIASGFGITKKGSDDSLAYYRAPQMCKILTKLHGSDIESHFMRLLVWANSFEQGYLFPSDKEIDYLLSQKLFMIAGEHDQVYEPNATLFPYLQKRSKMQRVTVLDSDHYDFFKPHVLPKLLKTITDLFPQATGVVDMRMVIQGCWELVSLEARNEETGAIIYPCGKDLVGSLIYSHDGFVSANIYPKDRPQYVLDNPSQATDQELARAAGGVISYCGSYSLTKEKVTHHISGCLTPNWVGTSQERFYKFDRQGQLALYTQPMPYSDGSNQRAYLVWRRPVTKLASSHSHAKSKL